jgi:glycosyltransferase involved in cell wall biosynthesis
VAPVSVVIPLYNEALSVGRLLHSLERQSQQPTEVVCVDAGSGDDTVDRIRGFSGGLRVRLVCRGRLNPGEARNEGVRHAGEDWIAFIDGGTVAEDGWLDTLMSEGAQGADVVFGSYEPVCDTFFRRCAALAYVPERSSKGIRGPFVASMLVRRDAFNTVGGFPPYRAAEDLIFVERLRSGAFRLAYAPEAVVHFETAPDVLSTFRRFALYSRVNLDAGRGRYWHYGLGRQYGLVAAMLCGGLVLGGGAWVLTLIPLWFGARVTKAAWKKKGDLPFCVFRPDHLAGAAGITLVLDLATWVGAARWLVGRLARRPSTRGSNA